MIGNLVSGQDSQLEISFSAKYYNQPILLDSISIQNLTQGGDTVLYGSDTVLVLEYVTGIGNLLNSDPDEFAISPANPNPFDGQTFFSISLHQKGEVFFRVATISGFEKLSFSKYLNPGIHKFMFTGGREDIYFLSASFNNKVKSIKLVSNSNQDIGCNVKYLGKESKFPEFKSFKQIKGFGFSLGDELRFIGYGDSPDEVIGSDVIDGAPETNSSIVFNIIDGIPCPGNPAFTYSGQIYKTVLIGNQCWMKENMNVGEYISVSVLPSDNGIIEKYCWNDVPDSCDSWGGLYQWYEVMQYVATPGVQGICPVGWHIPTDLEFESLANYLGGMPTAGGKVKETGTLHWFDPNLGATNESGFTAIGAGSFTYYGNIKTFNALREGGSFWTSTEYYTSDAWGWSALYDENYFAKYYFIKDSSISLRCLKD
jgi:uncharacterized protein (TIGR02145 family)